MTAIKGPNAYFYMYLQSRVWYSGHGIIGLSDKNELCTLYDQNSTYNGAVFISPPPVSSLSTLFW